MLLMDEEILRSEICHSINRYATANDKYIKDYGKNEELSYLKQLDVNNLYGWEISHKLLVEGFIQVEDLSEFIEDFIKSYNKKCNERYIFEVDTQYPDNLHELCNDLQFLNEIEKVDKVKKTLLHK